MQLWPTRSCGRDGSGWALEIRRRADDGEAHVRPDADRDHVLGELLAHADARIIALGDDVSEAVVARKLDLDVGILRQELLELGPKHAVDGEVRCHDPDRARGLVAQLTQRSDLRFNLIEARTDAVQQPLARFCRRHRARRPGEQPDAKALFKLAQRCGLARIAKGQPSWRPS